MSRARWLPAVALAAFFGAGLAWLGRDPRVGQEAFEPGSAWSTAPEGLSLAFAYLEERGGKVAMLDRRIDAREIEPEAVVFQLAPGWEGEWVWEEEEERDQKDCKDCKDEEAEEGEAAEEEGEAEEEEEEEDWEGAILTPREEVWIADGGRLVVAVGFGFGGLWVEEIETEQTPVKVFPLWPRVQQLAPPEPRYLDGPAVDDSHALWLVEGAPLVTRRRLGKGELIVLACPEIFFNENLGKADHLALLEALAPPGRPVYFDETLRGADASPGIFHLLGHYRLGSSLMLGLLALACFFWRSACRLGPAEEEQHERRTEAVDLVDSLARLYARALRPAEAIALYQQALREALAHHTGLSGAALEDRLARLSGQVEPAEFPRALARLNEAFRRLADEKHPRNR